MMGQLPDQQNALFYEFCLEKHIPEDHLLRQIDQYTCTPCIPPKLLDQVQNQYVYFLKTKKTLNEMK